MTQAPDTPAEGDGAVTQSWEPPALHPNIGGQVFWLEGVEMSQGAVAIPRHGLVKIWRLLHALQWAAEHPDQIGDRTSASEDATEE